MIRTFRAVAHTYRVAALAALIGVAAPSALAQAPPPEAAPPAQPSLDTTLTSLVQDRQALQVAEACNWSEPLYRLATEARLTIREAELRAQVPADRQNVINTALAVGNTAVVGFACQTPEGQSPPARSKVELFIVDQYWQMIAHVDVLGSYRWHQPFRFTPEERAALDSEIKHIREFKGYGYWTVGNPLETYADKTVRLACRIRPPAEGTCDPVPPEEESGDLIVRAMIKETEAFGKAVAAEKIKESKELVASIGGDATRFYTINDKACTRNAVVVNIGDAPKRTETTQDSFGSMTSEVTFAEKFLFGDPEPIGWVLLYRSLTESGGNPPYLVLAENGGDWDEDTARAGAGQVTKLSDTVMANIDARNFSPNEKAEAIATAKETLSETYFNNFKSMGLMQSLSGNGGVPLTQCPAL